MADNTPVSPGSTITSGSAPSSGKKRKSKKKSRGSRKLTAEQRQAKKKRQKEKKRKAKEAEDADRKKQEDLIAQMPENIDKLIQIANTMWETLKEFNKDDKKRFDHFKKHGTDTTELLFAGMNDTEKLDFFRNELEYKEYMTEYPIVTKYMIVQGQYSAKAYRRMLEKIGMMKPPPNDKRPKGWMEDQWIRRRADYIQYLWEAYQKSHIQRKTARAVWRQAYDTLKGEREDFKDRYKEVEKETKVEKKKHKIELTEELLERLASGKQELSPEEFAVLKSQLTKVSYKSTYRRLRLYFEKLIANKTKLYMRNVKLVDTVHTLEYKSKPTSGKKKSKPTSDDKKSTAHNFDITLAYRSKKEPAVYLKELTKIEPTCVGVGKNKNPVTEEKKKPTVRMIEYVDDKRYEEEVPDHIRATAEDLKPFRKNERMSTIDQNAFG